MRKFYREYFHVPEEGKIRERVIVARLTATIAVVVICLVAMSLTAYAYFSTNVSSDRNIIKSTVFQTDVSVQIKDSNGNAVEVRTADYKSHFADLIGGETYYITIKHTEKSTAQTGFIVVTASDCEKNYHTQQLGRDENGNTEIITFSIAPSLNTMVTFKNHWGTSSKYPDFEEKGKQDELYIINGETVALDIKAQAVALNDEETKVSSNATDGTASQDAVSSNTDESDDSTVASTPDAATNEDDLDDSSKEDNIASTSKDNGTQAQSDDTNDATDTTASE